MIDRNNLMRSIFSCQDMREEQGTRSPDIIYFYEDMAHSVNYVDVTERRYRYNSKIVHTSKHHYAEQGHGDRSYRDTIGDPIIYTDTRQKRPRYEGWDRVDGLGAGNDGMRRCQRTRMRGTEGGWNCSESGWQ